MASSDGNRVGRGRCPAPAESLAGDGTPALQGRKHLRRLDRIFDSSRTPVFLVTVCVGRRAPVLAQPTVARVLIAASEDAHEVHGWRVGRYVVMPDHVHLFASPSSQSGKDLSAFVGGWKNWTGRRIRTSGVPGFAWQREFFDHLLRSSESYDQKWEYVRSNPVRAGLVVTPDAWPYQGEIHVLRW